MSSAELHGVYRLIAAIPKQNRIKVMDDIGYSLMRALHEEYILHGIPASCEHARPEIEHQFSKWGWEIQVREWNE